MCARRFNGSSDVRYRDSEIAFPAFHSHEIPCRHKGNTCRFPRILGRGVCGIEHCGPCLYHHTGGIVLSPGRMGRHLCVRPKSVPHVGPAQGTKLGGECIPGKGFGQRRKNCSAARKLARHVSPLATTVYTHPSDHEMYTRVRNLPSRFLDRPSTLHTVSKMTLSWFAPPSRAK
jgi:hypothetical protein